MTSAITPRTRVKRREPVGKPKQCARRCGRPTYNKGGVCTACLDGDRKPAVPSRKARALVIGPGGGVVEDRLMNRAANPPLIQPPKPTQNPEDNRGVYGRYCEYARESTFTLVAAHERRYHGARSE